MKITRWYSPAPSELSISRISLDFGLRSADLFFRELVVPELGRVWFVRQISWPLAAIALHESLQSQGSNAPKPIAICHGIESLACKLEFHVDPQNPSSRILGRRAFGRDAESEVWTFQRLRQRSNYVVNTHRQAATRAIRKEGGLGFAMGSRFDLLALEPVGGALAEAFLEQRVGKGGTTLRRWLLGWINGERDASGWHGRTILKALSPEHPTTNERDLVRSRLLYTSTPTSEKRQHLARAVGRSAQDPDIEGIVVPRLRDAGHRQQADEVIAARAFGAVLDRARHATAGLTRAVEPGRGGVPITTLGRDSTVRKSLSSLKAAAKNFLAKADTAGVREPTSRAFAEALLESDDLHSIRLLVGRVGEVLGLSDGSVIRGALFRVVDSADAINGIEEGPESIEPDHTGRTFRIANLHSLLRDIGQRGTP